jgi:aminoglycoside phosphotransferase (APT) family kinase protein
MLKVSVLVSEIGESTVAAAARGVAVHETIAQRAETPLEAWQRGFARSHGDAVLFLTRDALIAPDHFDRLAARLEGAPELGAAFIAHEPDQPPHRVATRLLGRASFPRDESDALCELLGAFPLLRRSFVESVDLLGVRTAHGKSPDAIWARLSQSEQRIGELDRTLLAGEYADMAMRAVRNGAIAAARVRVKMLEAAAGTAHDHQDLLLLAALRSTDGMNDAELDAFLGALRRVQPESFARHIRALRDAEFGFSAFRAGNFDGALSGMVRAFRGAPQLISNVGAWSVFARACLNKIGVIVRREDVQAAVQQAGRALGTPVLGVADTGSGTNRNTYILSLSNERVLLRLLRGPQAVQRVESLVGLLLRLRAAGVRAPAVRAHGQLTGGDGGGDAAWIAEEFIASEISELWLMPRADAIRMAESLGRALRQVHNLNAVTFGVLHSAKPVDFAEWLESELPYDPEAESRLTHDIRVRLMHARDLLLAAPLREPAVLHGDLWPGNYLARPDGECVLIDWASARGGDPAYDPAVWYMSLRDRDLFEHFLRTYAPSHPSVFRARVGAYADLYAAYLLKQQFSNQRIDVARLHAQARRWLEDKGSADHDLGGSRAGGEGR